MSRIRLIHGSCADQTADAIVNAANGQLLAGGGICGVIFAKAGMEELTQACSKQHTPVADGQAVITPAFELTNAKAIIHAVGPNFAVTPEAFDELFNAYYNSLVVLTSNGYHSISFPLISSGIFGGNLDNPVGESTRECVRAYNKFLADHPDCDIDVMLCAFSDAEMVQAKEVFDTDLNTDAKDIHIKKCCRKYHWNREIGPCVTDYIKLAVMFSIIFIGTIITFFVLRAKYADIENGNFITIIPLFAGFLLFCALLGLTTNITRNWSDFELLREWQTEQDISDQTDELIRWYEITHHCQCVSQNTDTKRLSFKMTSGKKHTICISEIWDLYWNTQA